MAVTIIQQPINGCALSRPNIIYMNSNLANSWSDFRYIISFEWYDLDSATPNQPITIGKFRITPDPITKKGIFDVSTIARAYFENKFKGSYEVVAWQTDKVYVKLSYSFGEYYNGSEHFGIQSANYLKVYYYYDDIVSGMLYAPNVSAYPTAYNWLTDRDVTKITAPRGRNIYLPYNNTYAGTTTQSISAYSYINGVNDDSGATSVTISKQLVELNLCSYTLDNLVYGTFNDTIDEYRITAKKPLGEETTEAVIKYKCVKNNDMQLHFLNRYGAWETMSFDAINREQSTIERKTYKQKGYTAYNSSVVDYSGYVAPSLGFTTYVKDDRETIFWQNKQTEYTLTSGYICEQDFKWLQQLINSPKVYVEKYDQQFTIVYPCIIKTTQWTQKFSGADKMFNLELTINVSEQII